jgi:hypothetical protein
MSLYGTILSSAAAGAPDPWRFGESFLLTPNEPLPADTADAAPSEFLLSSLFISESPSPRTYEYSRSTVYECSV